MSRNMQSDLAEICGVVQVLSFARNINDACHIKTVEFLGTLLDSQKY